MFYIEKVRISVASVKHIILQFIIQCKCFFVCTEFSKVQSQKMLI